MRYTDLTEGAQAGLAEAWVVAGIFDSTEEVWVPRAMTRRQAAEEGLASTFVSVIEPYAGRSKIAGIRCVELTDEKGAKLPEPSVAVEVKLEDGRRDLLVSLGEEGPGGVRVRREEPPTAVQADWEAWLEAELAFIRVDAAGAVRRIGMCGGKSARIGQAEVRLKQVADYVEIAFEDGRAAVVSGAEEAVEEIVVAGRRVWPR